MKTKFCKLIKSSSGHVTFVRNAHPRAASARRGALMEAQTDWLGVGA